MRPLLLAMACLSCQAAEVEFLLPVWSPPGGFPATLRDVASRLPANTDARDADLVTYAHEGAHFLSSGRKSGYHGVYVGDGVRVFVATPPLTTAEVFAAIPVAKRGTIYETYLKQGMSEYWQTQPLMILDEWNAYLTGARARAEMLMDSRLETNVHCATMAGYAQVMYDLAQKKAGYPIQELKDFCNWQLVRCRETIPDWDQLSDARFD